MFDKEENRKKLHELLDIVLDGNGLGERSRALTGTLPTLFFRYSGHIARVDIDLCSNGWTPGMTYDKNWYISTDEPITTDVVDDVRAAVLEAMRDDITADEMLANDIKKAEKDLRKKAERIAQMKRELEAMRKKGE